MKKERQRKSEYVRAERGNSNLLELLDEVGGLAVSQQRLVDQHSLSGVAGGGVVKLGVQRHLNGLQSESKLKRSLPFVTMIQTRTEGRGRERME